MKPKFTFRIFLLLSAVALPIGTVSAIESGTANWNGGTGENGGEWTNDTFWSTSTAPVTGEAPTSRAIRINVNNGSNNALIYSAAQGHTIYTGVSGRTLASTASGSMTITGGTFDSRGSSRDFLANGTGRVNSLTIDGGNYTNVSGGASDFCLTIGSGTGTLTVKNGSFTAGQVQAGEGSGGGTGIVNIEGGTLTTGRFTRSGSGTISSINFDGGILQARANQSDFLPTSAVILANVKSGGTIIDTNNFSIGFARALTEDAISTGGGLTLNDQSTSGNGTLTITGENTYSGATTVTRGTLALGESGSIELSSGINVASGGTFNVSAVNNWTLLSGQALNVAGSVTGDVIVASGATLGGTGTMNGDASVEDGAGLVFDIDSAPVSHPPLNIASGKTLTTAAGSSITINLGEDAEEGTYTLVTGGENIAGTVPATVFAPPGWSGTAFLDGNNLKLTLTESVVVTVTFDENAVDATEPVPASKEVTVGAPYGALAVTSRPGFALQGWSTESDGSGLVTPQTDVTINENHTLYAVWTAKLDGTWDQRLAGTYSWDTQENWVDGLVAIGKNATATFEELSGSQTVTLDTARIIGNIDYTNENDFLMTFSGSALTLEVDDDMPVINTASRTLRIENEIVGDDGLQKEGAGTLVLAGENSYAGGTAINAGALYFEGIAAMPDSGEVAVSDSTLGVTVGGAGNWSGDTSGVGTLGGLLDGVGGAGTSTVSYIGDVGLRLDVLSATEFAGSIDDAGDSDSLSLIKTGTGTLTLTGSNSYTGGTILNQGTVTVDTGGTLGATTGTLFVNSGSSLNVAADTAVGVLSGVNNGNVTIQSDRTFTVNQTENSTYGGTITGSGGNFTLGSTSTSTLTLTGNNTYSGTTNIEAGILRIGAGGSSGSLGNTNTTIASGAELRFDRSEHTYSGQLLGSGTVSIISSRRVNFNTNQPDSGNLAFAVSGILGLVHGSSIEIHLGELSGNGVIQRSGQTTTSPPSLIIGDKNTDSTFSGTITPSNVASAMSVEKVGSKTLSLSGSSHYTGATTVSEGTLLINGSIAAGSAVAVNNDATIGGSGTINGSVTVAEDANVSPGASVGQLTVGNLNVSAMADGAGKLFFELGPIAASDRIAVTGTLEIGSGVLGLSDFDFTEVGGLEEGDYILISSGGISGTLDTSDLQGTIGIDDTDITLGIIDNDIVLTVGEVSGTPYDSWAGGAPFDGDSNGDGVSNGLAFLLGAGNPNDSALDLLPAVSEDTGGLVLTFSMRNAASRGPATLSVQWSNDLGVADEWSTNTAQVPETTSTVNDVAFVITPNGTTNNVVATIPASKAAGGKLFGRLAGEEN